MDWISVKDKLPDVPKNHKCVNVIVAVYDGLGSNDEGYGNMVIDMSYFKDLGFMEYMFGQWDPVLAFDEVTHWMYYPEAPKRNPDE